MINIQAEIEFCEEAKNKITPLMIESTENMNFICVGICNSLLTQINQYRQILDGIEKKTLNIETGFGFTEDVSRASELLRSLIESLVNDYGKK